MEIKRDGTDAIALAELALDYDATDGARFDLDLGNRSSHRIQNKVMK